MTTSKRSFRRLPLVAGVIALALLCLAAKEFSMPKFRPAASYPAHDYHSAEKVTVAIDPYDTQEKAKVFVVHYQDLEVMPLLMVVTNDGDTPVELTGMKAQLVTGDGSKLSPETSDDIYRRISHPHASGARIPIPFPTKRVKGGVSTKEWNEIENSQFKARAVEPRSSQAGFLFFDISDISKPLEGAHLYLTGVRDGAGNELMYFDVPLDKYLQKAH
jgi:hypothetical protein